jgi:hypothetical protein
MNFYRSLIEQPGKGPLFCMLVALLVTFLATRVITRRIRAGSKALGNWHVGGVHVHHQVFGIIAVLISGGLEFTYRPAVPWSEVLAAIFGFGVSLTLDEFALWLHLDDVYWTPEGRKSVDAVFVAAVICALMLVGVTPLDLSGLQHEVLVAVAALLLVNLGPVVLALLKGKPIAGITGLFLPLVAIIAAIRLAKPRSQWAAWRYGKGSAKRARAERRFGPGYQARWNRLRDLVGGAPDLDL